MQQQTEISERFFIVNLESEMSAVLTSTSCAWCNHEDGIPQGEGSHGICDRHAEQQYNALKLRIHKLSFPDTKS